VQGVVDGAADGHPWPLLLWALELLPRDGVTACYCVGGWWALEILLRDDVRAARRRDDGVQARARCTESRR
jgi:hypothetical protein